MRGEGTEGVGAIAITGFGMRNSTFVKTRVVPTSVLEHERGRFSRCAQRAPLQPFDYAQGSEMWASCFAQWD